MKFSHTFEISIISPVLLKRSRQCLPPSTQGHVLEQSLHLLALSSILKLVSFSALDPCSFLFSSFPISSLYSSALESFLTTHLATTQLLSLSSSQLTTITLFTFLFRCFPSDSAFLLFQINMLD